MRGWPGLTLVELAVALAVFSLLLAFSLAGMSQLTQNLRLAAALNQLTASLALARSHAVRSAAPVVICKSADGRRCSGEGGWEQGWLLFEDGGGNRQCEAAPGADRCQDGGRLLQVQPRLDGADLTLRASGNPRNRVVFSALGTAAGYPGTFSACDGRGIAAARGIVIQFVGRVRPVTANDELRCPD